MQVEICERCFHKQRRAPRSSIPVCFGGANVADARERTPKCGLPTEQTDWTTIGANSAFFGRKQLPVSLRVTITTISASSTLATHRGQTSALTATWTDSQTHLDNDFQCGLHTHRLTWTPRDQCGVGKKKTSQNG